MQEVSNKYLNDYDDELDLKELLHALLRGKWIIASATSAFSIIGIMYSLSLPNIYESEALLVNANSSNGATRSLTSYSNLAGFAGINLPSSGKVSNSVKAVRKINSLSFFENNILPNIYLPNLMAVKSWNSKTNTVVYDKNIYNIKDNTWIGEHSISEQNKPSAQESFAAFQNKLSFIEDKKSGFGLLSIKHQSPFIAKQLVELVVNEVNSFYRQKDKLESEKASEYLNLKISMTGFTEIKQVLAQLLQEETKKLALIEANQSYVFDYIDPPAVMEVRAEPNRLLIFILSTLLGGILSIIIVLVRHYIFNEKA